MGAVRVDLESVDHDSAVTALRRSYAAVPSGEPIRLAKRTSNLFRPRTEVRTPGLDVSGLTGVISVDPAARTADVQGMCTYENLVDATLPHGLMPLVVPQLRTITLGGAVTGLGIESTSFRNGLPHESVTELDVLTGSGEIVTARPGGEHADLFAAFPNSMGSLGYATRLRIELQPVRRHVALRNVRFTRLEALTDAVAEVTATRSWDGVPVDAMDGVMFSPGEAYLVFGTFTDEGERPSDYTGQDIYYRSLRRRIRDTLTTYDYLWRWDTDWFWCSSAFGVQHPVVRRLWPARYRRSDVYHRLVRLEHRHGVAARIE
ncbi:FAD-binding oxidoreductase, partial [Micromonospora azadirachtae]